MRDKVKLPDMPATHQTYDYDETDMQHYARAAVALNGASVSAEESTQPVAWLYTCGKPGERIQYASVDADDSNHWPVDQWVSVLKEPLVRQHPVLSDARDAKIEALTTALLEIRACTKAVVDDPTTFQSYVYLAKVLQIASAATCEEEENT